MALLALFLGLREKLELEFELEVLHVNHGLREESAKEEAFVRAFCERHHLPLQVFQMKPEPSLGSSSTAVEERARQFRRRCFQTHLLEKKEAEQRRGERGKERALVLAHHQEDQLETIWLHLLRGCDLPGLAGMQKESAQSLPGLWLLRPLLEVRRSTLRSLLAELGLSFCEDASNFCLDFDRNFLRQQWLLELRERFPKAERQLLALGRRVSLRLREEEEDLRRFFPSYFGEKGTMSTTLTSQEAATTFEVSSPFKEATSLSLESLDPKESEKLSPPPASHQRPFFLSRREFLSAPHSLQRPFLYRWLQEEGLGRDIQAHHLEQMQRLLQQGGQKAFSLPQQAQFAVEADWFFLQKGGGTKAQQKAEEERLFQQVGKLWPDFLFLKKAEWERLQRGEVEPALLVERAEIHYNLRIWILQQLAKGESLRLRQAGDVYRTTSGHLRPLKTYFQEMKLPVFLRPRLCLLAHEKEILWPCGRGMRECKEFKKELENV